MVSAVLNLLKKDTPCCDRQQEESDCTFLSGIENGRKVSVIGFQAGKNRCVNDECGSCAVEKLESMGLFVGAEVEVISNSGKGPIVFRSGEARLALGRGICSKVIVE